MKFPILAAAAVFALAPMTAGAVTSYNDLGMSLTASSFDGGTYNSTPETVPVPGGSYGGTITGNNGSSLPLPGWALFRFDLEDSDRPTSLIEVTTEFAFLGKFSGVEVAFVDAARANDIDDGGVTVTGATGGSVLSSGGGATTGVLTDADIDVGLSIRTDMVDNLTDPQWLAVTWADVSDNASGLAFEVTATPLPAGALLIGTAFVGAGLISRRRRKAA